jgi:hypothetical protein
LECVVVQLEKPKAVQELHLLEGRGGQGREGKGREGKGREGKGREGKGRG